MLIDLRVENYKSLRNVSIRPGRFTVFAGANGSGKSNLGDCLDFVRDVYANGLELAVARKGGYENIAHRKMRRTKLPISFTVRAALSGRARDNDKPRPTEFEVRHSFGFVATGSSIRAKYRISHEDFSVMRRAADDWEVVYTANRKGDELKISTNAPETIDERALGRAFTSRDLTRADDLIFFAKRTRKLRDTELFVNSFGRFVPAISAIMRLMSGIKVSQFSPSISREVGVPSPVPELGRYGANLPAVVELLKKDQPQSWRAILHAMRLIVPGLYDIEVDYTSNRRLGLFFHEKGVGRPWTTEDVSDGTIQSLALLVAIFDPRPTVLFLEEPENSVHPWIIKALIQSCRQASRRKQIMVTTHSPVVIDFVSPADVVIIWRQNGETHASPLTELDRDILRAWESGEVSTFKFLESGVVRQSVPPAAQLELSLRE